MIFAYSDVSYADLMHKASLVNAVGADFRLLGAAGTMIRSSKPVVAVCAVRTGCGKSQTSRRVAELLRRRGKSVVVVRHPMPYGDLNAQRCQRFEVLEDLDRYRCTIEEREEYESHILQGNILYAGVDYEEILRNAEKEADIILWDGGNNDLPFYQPGPAHRAGGPAPAGARAPLLSGGNQFADGGCGGRQQVAERERRGPAGGDRQRESRQSRGR